MKVCLLADNRVYCVIVLIRIIATHTLHLTQVFAEIAVNMTADTLRLENDDRPEVDFMLDAYKISRKEINVNNVINQSANIR